MPNAIDIGRDRQIQLEPFTSWTPDKPPLESQGLTFVQNAVPTEAGFYRPAQGPKAESGNALTDLVPGVNRVAGGIGAFKDLNTGRVTLYAGGFDPTANKGHLFAYSEAAGTWSDVSRAGFYRFDRFKQARFAPFGEDQFACLGTSEPLQVIKGGTTGPFQDVKNSPRAGDIAVVRDFLVAINFRHRGNSFPDFVMWSAIGDPRTWPTPGTLQALALQSGLAQLPAGGRLQRIIPGIGGADAIIFGEGRIWRMTFIGPPSVWRFDVADYDQGTAIRGSVAATNELAFYFGREGFAAFDGATSHQIGAGVIDKTWLEDPAFAVETSDPQGRQNAIEAAADSAKRNYLIAYRKQQTPTTGYLLTEAGDIITAENGNRLTVALTTSFNDGLLIYNWVSQQWGHADIAVDSIARVETEISTIDQPRLVAVGQDFKLATLDGALLEFIVDTPERMGRLGQQITIHRILPMIGSPSVLARLLIRDNQFDAPVLTPERGLEVDGQIPVRETARFYRVRVRVPAGSLWRDQALGVQCEIADRAQGRTT